LTQFALASVKFGSIHGTGPGENFCRNVKPTVPEYFAGATCKRLAKLGMRSRASPLLLPFKVLTPSHYPSTKHISETSPKVRVGEKLKRTEKDETREGKKGK
jgi:hypothetical protein